MVDYLQRKPNRLKGYKYNQNGAYFITICIQNRANVLGSIVGEGFSVPKEIQLSEQGEIVRQFICDLSVKYPQAKIDKYVIMPNHIHLILILDNGSGISVDGMEDPPQNGDAVGITRNGTENPSPTVGVIIGWFKYQTTKQISELLELGICKLWQRSFHDHIIRNDEEYREIWDYIDTNPQRWEDDSLFNDIQVNHTSVGDGSSVPVLK